MKRIKHFINTILWTLLCLYGVVVIVVNVPTVQVFIGRQVADAISSKLGTKASVGRVDVGLFNRLVIDDVSLRDHRNVPFFQATRLSVKVGLLAALKGDLGITSAQVFGMKARLYRATADSPLNIQFVIDSLASKDTTQHKPLDLQINSLVIRHGAIRYDQLDAPRKTTFDLHHVAVSDLSSHIMLNVLRDDSLNLRVKKIAFNERSGLKMKSLSFKVVAGLREAIVSDFDLKLPRSQCSAERLSATYLRKDGKVDFQKLHFQGSINPSYVSPSDLAFLDNKLKRYVNPLVFSTTFTGGAHQLHIQRLDAIIARDAYATSLSSPAMATLGLSGTLSSWDKVPRWTATIRQLTVGRELLPALSPSLPAIVQRLGNISYHGVASGQGRNVSTKGTLQVDEGQANLTFAMTGNTIDGHLDTDGIDLGEILDNDQLGLLAANLHVDGDMKQQRFSAKGTVHRFEWNNYPYKNMHLDVSYDQGHVSGNADVSDTNIAAAVQGSFDKDSRNPSGNVSLHVSHINPTALGLTGQANAGTVYGGRLNVAFSGNSLSTLQGKATVKDFYLSKSNDNYQLDGLELNIGSNAEGRYLTFDSDFGHAKMRGHFDYATLRQNIENIIVDQLPSLQKFSPLRRRSVSHDSFTLEMSVTRADWLRHLIGLPIEINAPVDLYASVNSHSRQVDVRLNAPDVVYDNRCLRNLSVNLSSPDNNLCADVKAVQAGANGRDTDLHISAVAKQDELSTELQFDNHAKRHRFRGRLLSMIQFDRNSQGGTEARFHVRPSELAIGDTLFAIHPASVVYSKNHLQVNDVSVSSGNQYVKISGETAKGSDEPIIVDLKDVNVEYVLDLVGFHSVDFSGLASGRAYLTHLFDSAGGHADLYVNKFEFEEGNMGTLMAKVGWNKEEEQIDIDAQAVDTIGGSLFAGKRLTSIKGYVSPKRNYMDLAIKAHDTRGEFAESFCSSFMRDADLSINGDLRLWGDLKQLNLTGEALVNGKLSVKPLNTTYQLHDAPIRFLVNEIQFPNDVVYDRSGNTAIINGSVYHQHLSRLTYDFGIELHHLLGYDWDGRDGSTFYGTVYASGDVRVKGRSGEVDIDIDATPQRGSQIVYNVSNPDAIASREFINWSSRDTITNAADHVAEQTQEDDEEDFDMPSDIRINFLINTHPDATLKVIMDNNSGDYIALNGSGVIRAAYYNKGSVDVFGNYLIDHGVYKLTIQNIIKRDFEFLQGGMIAFGGDPYQADLNLKAQYQVNSVSLSDLQLGRSFSSNNIRVNCLMNITGTPSAPKVDFNIDMPTVGSDAKQMIYSVINSEEEMNQQVLYLLAVGRFLSPSSNNSSRTGTGEKQTSLAMQSILSGQLSQQINNVLSNIVNNSNWNFGANISTGDEGWNNAEYEGLLSGRMLNNRLLINGQFGYRDNANATTTFIGDFDIRYLISPNGNFGVRVYNQTNDRYFTRNSLNTQGIGFVLKRDFNGWHDLFGLRKKNRKTPNAKKIVKKP